MNQRTQATLVALILVFLIAVAGAAEKKAGGKKKAGKKAAQAKTLEGAAAGWKDTFDEAKSDLVSTGKNPYFSLEPGYVLHLESGKEGEKADLTITVLDETKMVDGVETRIVEERETEDGEVTEVSRNYFAISNKTNTVYYFGEETKAMKNGRMVVQNDSWESGKNGARFGMIMPGKIVIGEKYYQEVAPEVAMDRAENVSVSETVEVPAGKFENCLKTEESSGIEPGKEFKLYAPGVGLLKDGNLLLTRYGKGEGKVPEAGAKAGKAAKKEKAGNAKKAGKAGKGKAAASAQEKKASVAASELPAAIKKAIEEALPKGEIIEVQKEAAGENPGQYDVSVRSEGKEFDLEISPEGKVLETKPRGK